MSKQVRLDKYLADMNVGTRSEVKSLIKKKRVKVNGVIVNKDNLKIDIENDEVTLGDRQIF